MVAPNPRTYLFLNGCCKCALCMYGSQSEETSLFSRLLCSFWFFLGGGGILYILCSVMVVAQTFSVLWIYNSWKFCLMPYYMSMRVLYALVCILYLLQTIKLPLKNKLKIWHRKLAANCAHRIDSLLPKRISPPSGLNCWCRPTRGWNALEGLFLRVESRSHVTLVTARWHPVCDRQTFFCSIA